MGAVTATLARLAGQRVYIDTNVFIYFLDRHETFFEVSAAFLQACMHGEVFGMTGDAAVAEVMVAPYRQDNTELVARLKRFFSQKNFLTIVSHSSEIFDAAAMLVAKNRLKFIDALHVATAEDAQCRYLLTNDAGIKSTENMEVILLSTMLDAT